VTFTARAQADAFKAAGILRPELPVFEVIEGSSTFTTGDQSAARAATGLSGDPCLLWVGNLDANKDPLMVLDAVAAAVGALPNLRLHMCYRYAPLLEAVRSRIAAPALAGRVTLHGEIGYPQIEAHFRAADFVVQASHAEGSGYGVIEALACGTTPLVTDIPSFGRITGDGEFGALVPLGESGALARAIEDWSRRDRALLRRRAREHFERSLSFEAIGRQLLSAYRQLHRPS
jgi:glycosyltransferase involved in cell wall biosynthesis